jgi:hypothetical protein
MRYHKAILITRPEADFIIRTCGSSLNECVVLNHSGKWYDTRRMTEKELADFVDDLKRADLANEAAGGVTPH